MAEPIAEAVVEATETTGVSSPDTTPVSTLIPKETYLTETSSSDHDNYDLLKLQTLDLWCQQQQKLGNLPTTGGDRYQIMRQGQPLGIDAFVADTMRLSPNLTPTQALTLLQSCIQIMPKTGGNQRPVGRPGWFLRSASERYSSAPGPILLTFCPNTGKINTNLPIVVLLIAVGHVLAIFSRQQV